MSANSQINNCDEVYFQERFISTTGECTLEMYSAVVHKKKNKNLQIMHVTIGV